MVGLKHLKFVYYPSQSFYTKKQMEKDDPNLALKVLADDQRLNSKVFNVMSNININVAFEQALKEHEGALNAQRKTNMNVEVSIPQIDLKLKPEIYNSLLRTGELLTAVNEAHMEYHEEIYKKMVLNKIKGGSLFVQEKRFGSTVWVKYECLFSKDYLYFFKTTADLEKPALVTSLKDAKILDSDNPQEKNVFIIEGKPERTLIKTESLEEREEWVKTIRDKMVEYMLIAMVPKSKLQVDFEQEAAKKKQAKELAEVENKPKDYNVIEMTAKLEIKQIKLTVYRNDTDLLFDFQTDNFSAKVKQSASLMLVDLKLDAIESTDYLFQYTNPDLKMFMTSVPPGVNADETDEDLVEIKVCIMEKDHPDYHKTRTAMTIGVQLGYFFVNFKPGTIQQIMGMFIPPAPPGAPVEEAKATQAQEVVYSSDQDDMVMDVSVNMSTIGVRLIHKTTYCCLAELALTKTIMKIKMYNDWMQFTGKFDNLQLFDTTNYPYTIDSDVEYQKVKKYELFGAAEGQKDLIDLSFTSYDPKHPNEAGKKDKIFSFVVVNVKSVKIDYLQQPILRILDYLTGQLLPSINTGEIPKMAKELAEQTLGAPQFMDLKVHLQSPVIILKPKPDSREYLELRFVSIDVGSKRVQDANRISHPQVPFIYCERFIIKLCEMGMFKIKEGKGDLQGRKLRQPISRNFNFEMFFEMPMFIEEYKILYETPQSKLNIANKLVGNMTPMILHLRKKDYLLIMKCLNFNIAYDDANDPMFVSDYEQVLKAQSEPGNPMNMHIGIQNLSMIMLEDNMIPYAMVNLHLLNVDIEMFENKEMKIDISGAELNGSFFEYLNNQLKEHKLLGNLNEKNAFTLDNITRENAVERVAREVRNYAKHIKMLYYAQKFQLVRQLLNKAPAAPRKKPLIFSMFMQPNGNKAMQIYVNQLRTFCAAGTFMKLSDFAVMDESCDPGLPTPYKNPSPIKAGISNTVLVPPVGSMKIEIEVDDIEIAIPPTKESSKTASNAIAIRGDVSLLMVDSPPLKVQEYVSQLKSANKTAPKKASDQINDFNKIGHLGVKLKEFEIFVCDYRELLNADSFRKVRKRNLLLPLVMDFSRVTYMVPNQKQDDLIMCMKNNVQLEPIVVRMSYNDILLLNKSSQIQLDQLPPPEDPNNPAPPKKELELSSHYESSDDEVPTERPDYHHTVNESVTYAAGHKGPKITDKSNMSAYSVEKPQPKAQKGNVLAGLTDEKQPVQGVGFIQNIGKVPEKAALGDVVIDIPVNNKPKDAAAAKGAEATAVAKTAPVDKNWASTDDFDIKSNGIKIVLINDAEGLLVPVLEFKIAEIVAGMLMIAENMYITGRLILACSYFNSVPSQWEPIIEKFGLDFTVAMEENPKMQVSLSTNQNFKTFQLNISEQMVSTLYSTMITWQNGIEPVKKKTQNQAFALLQTSAKSKKLEQEDIIDFVSPYTIMNQTGYPINVQADKTKEELAHAGVSAVKLAKKTYFIQNNDSTQYKMEADIEEAQDTKNLDDFNINTNKIKVHVLHPTLNFAEIKGIDIDRPNVAIHKLQLLDDPSNKNSYVLVSDVRIIKQKKILTLTSPYRIKNHIPEQIFDITIDSQARNLQTILHPNETFALPIDYLDGQITIQDESKASIAAKKNLTDFFVAQNISSELNTGSKIALIENKTLDTAKKVFKATIRPTIQLKNCCIGNLCYKVSSQASGTSSQAAVHTLKPQETKQELKISLNSQVYIEVMLPGYQWSNKILVHSTNPKDKVVSEVKLVNQEGQSLDVHLFVTEESLNESKHKAKTILFYTKTCIVNETDYDLDYFYLEKSKKVKVPTQRAGAVYLTTQDLPKSKTDLEAQNQGRVNHNVTMMNQVEKIFISRADTGETTKQINIAQVGSQSIELRNTTGQSSLLELGLSITLKECDFQHKLVTKVITISPRYILINKTDYKLEIKPEVIDKVLLTLDKDIRTPLHWTSWQPVGANKAMETKKSLTMRCLDPAQEWNWSTPFDITTMGSHNFYVYNTAKSQQKFFKVTITLDSSILYISIKEELREELTYRIQNDCPDLTFQVHQVNKNPLPQNTFKILPNSSLPWAWTFSNNPKEILAQIIYPDGTIYNHPRDLKFSFYTLNKDFEINIPVTGGKKSAKQKIHCSVRLIKNVYTIKFYHPKPATDLKQDFFGTLIMNVVDNLVNMDVKVSLHSIGISVISSVHSAVSKRKERRELLYILLQGLEVSLVDSLQSNTSQIKLKHFSIDNNTVNNTSHPVLLASTKSRSPTDKKCFLDILITKKNITEVAFFETIEFFLDDTSLNVDGPFIEVILQVADNFTRIFTADDGSEEFGPICDGLYKNTKTAIKLEDEAFYESKIAWHKPELQEFQGNLFIENLRIFPLFFNVTFQLKKANASENAFIALNILTGALGTALANLDRAPISLAEVRMTDIYDSQEGITDRIVGKYKGGATGNALKVLGSLDILGNPVGLVRSVGTGVADVVRKPYQGFKKGPVQGLVGIPAGVGSLVTNTVAGVFNSFSKITGSVANGVSNMTLDDKYLEVREKIKTKRPRHIGQGLSQAGESIAQGLYGGVTGLVKRPVEGARENGFKGAAKGTYQGVFGLVLKPVGGLLDAASKTTEGVKNTALFWQKRTDEDRYRHPRPFYGKDQFYKPYRELDAEMMKALKQKSGKEFENVELVCSIDLFPDQKDTQSLYILGITYGPVVYWSAKKKKIIWKFLPKDVDRIEIKEGEVNIWLNKPAYGIKKNYIHIVNPDQEENEFVYNKVLELKAYCP